MGISFYIIDREGIVTELLSWISLVILRDYKESINQSKQNSNIYINIIIKQFNRLHYLQNHNDFHFKETNSKNRRRYLS